MLPLVSAQEMREIDDMATRQYGITSLTLMENTMNERLTIVRSFKSKGLSRKTFDFIVDAIFGTSFHGEVRGKYKDVVGWINSRRGSRIVAVDVPSGIDATTGKCTSVAIRAHRTVTMALPKIGLYLGSGREYS